MATPVVSPECMVREGDWVRFGGGAIGRVTAVGRTHVDVSYAWSQRVETLRVPLNEVREVRRKALCAAVWESPR
jgi:preprotein translocase subunit YajC